ncbi:pyridoxine 5'-phosphate synthase [Phaeodactylibacter xiamenensis]|jgi:pyridoxine 5-phosphate synthase|uniref:pyridoxine 5'-phosphate synthase n=1 Tax=Phaeodactylibacter xiamenensis TaxID=1524460 RepID=UPI0024A7A74F|nr:pyridoxine 5'-phosphate synthase [Phaeodactylibacter xiamenensis]
MPTRLSVNINKVALIRNARLGNLPDLVQVAKDCERFGAEGITVHPRPDERHIRYSDIPQLKAVNTTEFNIEGNPTEKFMELVQQHQPTQATLVPDSPDVLTSDQGWDTVKHKAFLIDITQQLHAAGVRVSIFVDPVAKYVEGAKAVGADRIEFYTGDYAKQFEADRQKAVAPHVQAAKVAREAGLGINAGHDLNLDNLRFYQENIEGLLEVSIGHALISDALYFGLSNTIQLYLRQLG